MTGRAPFRFLAALGLALAAGPALAQQEPAWIRNQTVTQKQLTGGHQMMPQAARVQRMPSTINLGVGEKASYKGPDFCGVENPKIVRMEAGGGVVTVLGLQEGSTKLLLFGGGKRGPPTGKPNEVQIKVHR